MALQHLMDWIKQQGGRIDLPNIPDSLLVVSKKGVDIYHKRIEDTDIEYSAKAIVGSYNECIEDTDIEYSAKALEAFARQMIDHGHLLLTLLKEC
jgi:hypothetical protein